MGRTAEFDIRGAYEQALRKRSGELPTVRDVAAQCGATVELVRYHLRHMGLPYARMTHSEAASISAQASRARAEERLRTRHAAFVERNGRAPTIGEMNLMMGVAVTSGDIAKAARRLGLELARRRREKVKLEVKAITPTDTEFKFGEKLTPRIDRVLEIQQGEEAAPGEGWDHAPGEGYAATDRVMLTCPVCGSRKLIAPRMHPFWLRNRAGAVIFVCREACTGRITGG